MKKRKLVAALACRNNGTRLYGKPLQILYKKYSIIDQIIHAIKQFPQIEDICLGVASGPDNLAFVDVALNHNIKYIFGDPLNVLQRLIDCSVKCGATDIFRVTTECPWFAYEMVDWLWQRHLADGNDITVCDGLPEGLHFEIYTHNSLLKSHENGSALHRSEYCSSYARENYKEFKIGVYLPSIEFQRLDLRVTVDNPEDLILCRAIAAEFESDAPLVPLDKIINFIDAHPELMKLVHPFVNEDPLWSFPDK